MQKYFSLLLFIFVSYLASGQNQNSLSTPFESLQLFVESTKDASYRPEAASIIVYDSARDQSQKTKVVKNLDQILRGSGIIIELESISKNKNFYDSLRGGFIYVINEQLPNIYLKKVNQTWVIEAQAIKEIEKKHDELFRFGTNLFLSEKMKKTSWGTLFMGLQLWQWLGIAFFTLLGLLVRLIISLFFRRLLLKYLKSIGRNEIGEKIILPIVKPLSTFSVLVVLAIFYPLLGLPATVGQYLVLILKSLIPFFATIILYRSVSIVVLILEKLALKTDSTLDDQLVPLVQKILKVIIVIVGGLVIMDSVDVPILPLLTGLSIGGLAFALAAQDTIKNFFGSMMIFVDKPFQIGDWISSGDIDGTVEEVGFRSSRVRTFRNSVVYVPNGKLADSVIDNHGLRQFRRFRMMIALKYDTPPIRIEAFVEGLKKVLLRHPKTNKEKFEIHLNEMGSSSLDVLFYIFFEAPTWTEELKFRQEIILDILKLGEKLSVGFAYPTQTVNIENLPGQASLSQVYTLTKQDLDNRLKEFFDE